MFPTNTAITFAVKSDPKRSAAVAYFVAEGQSAFNSPNGIDADLAAVRRLIDAKVVTGKAREVAFDLVDENGSVRRVYVIGVGKAEKLSAETVRQGAGALLRSARKHKLDSISIHLNLLPASDAFSTPAAVATGMALADFDFLEHKGTAKKKDDADRKPLVVTIIAPKENHSAVTRAVAVAGAQNFARTIASRPGNVINPPSLAKISQDVAKKVGLSFKVLDEKQMAKLGMGGILAVGAGSRVTPPRMIVLEWKGSEVRGQESGKTVRKKSAGSSASSSSNPLLLVGKAVTFDTGGISIKPADKMGHMIYDKCGGMTVLGVMTAVATLKLPVHVVGIIGAAENHISDTAFRPGDILKMYNGVTVEVTNTDAEGRLVLGDALAWGIETYKPSAVVDLATLTGGVRVALGTTMAGVMGNDDELIATLTKLGEIEGEKMWRLPVGEDQREQIKSHHADIVNSAGREAHPLQGAAFLSYFVPEKLPWAHLDIAAVADTEKTMPYYEKGATGWGVRTLVEWIASKATR